MDNPLQTEWTNAFGLAPFDQIKDRHFAPAIDRALASTRVKIGRIANAKDTPSFVNTIDALEQADHDLGRILSVFYNLASADSTAERRDLQRDLAPKLAALRSEIAMNAGLFTRIEELWNKKQDLDLTHEQQRVLMLTRRDMIRSGAALDEADQKELARIMDELAQLQTSFTQNLLADESAWNIEIPADVAEKMPTKTSTAITENSWMITGNSLKKTVFKWALHSGMNVFLNALNWQHFEVKDSD